MNKVFNSLTFIVSLPALLFAFVVGLNETYGVYADLAYINENPEYKMYVYTTTAILVFLIGFRRSYKKWVGIRVVNQINRYHFNSAISEERRKRVVLFNFIESFVFFLLGISFTLIAKDAALVSLVFFIFIADSFVNTIRGIFAEKYRVGMTKKAIVFVDRDVKVIYFKGLKRISVQNGILFFEYVNDLVLELHLSNIPINHQREFMDSLQKTVDEKKVYFSGLESIKYAN